MNFNPSKENHNNLNKSTFYNNDIHNPFEGGQQYTEPFQLGSPGDLFSPGYAPYTMGDSYGNEIG